ncbi:hypothetical protein D3C78_998710 [compost metagenome]
MQAAQFFLAGYAEFRQQAAILLAAQVEARREVDGTGIAHGVFRRKHEVDEAMGERRVRRIRRDRQAVDEQQAAFCGNAVAQLAVVVGGIDQAAPGHARADLAGAHLLDVCGEFRRADVDTGIADQWGRGGDPARSAAAEAAALVGGPDGKHLLLGIQQADAACRQALRLLRLEQQAPAVRQLAPVQGGNQLGVDEEPDRSPHVGHHIAMGLLDRRELDLQVRADAGVVGQRVRSDRLKTLFLQQFDEYGVAGGDDHVVAFAALQALQHFP